ncbi:unnamed protein product [Closterium sp. NIES-53]
MSNNPPDLYSPVSVFLSHSPSGFHGPLFLPPLFPVGCLCHLLCQGILWLGRRLSGCFPLLAPPFSYLPCLLSSGFSKAAATHLSTFDKSCFLCHLSTLPSPPFPSLPLPCPPLPSPPLPSPFPPPPVFPFHS